MKNILFAFILAFSFSACFSLQALNPFSRSKDKKEIVTPNNAPQWLKQREVKHHISAIGVTKKIEEDNITTQKKRALIVAGNNLLKRIYSKTINIYKRHIGEEGDINIFDNDIKEYAKQVSLNSLNTSKIRHTWISEEKELFVQITIDNNYVAQQIQLNAKKLFKSKNSTWLYKNFLSNMAKSEIIKQLEE